MVTEEMLEKARRKYPIGTKFISAYSPERQNYTVTENIYKIYGTNDIVVNNASGPSVYSKGKWAEIIESPNKIHELWI